MTVQSGCRTLEETLRGMQLGLLTDTLDVDAALNLYAERVNAWQVIGDGFAASGVAQLAKMLARLGYHERQPNSLELSIMERSPIWLQQLRRPS